MVKKNTLLIDLLTVNKDQYSVWAGAVERHIRKERHLVRVFTILILKGRSNRDHHLTPLGIDDFHLRLILSDAFPMIHDREFQKHRRKTGEKDVLEHSHQRQLISHFDANIVTDNAID